MVETHGTTTQVGISACVFVQAM
uniref:Uncharacterized protein n=1 Tax=Anguilla anguilla TaxID=7936 RepID=A0A0E9S7K8_ANGAN